MMAPRRAAARTSEANMDTAPSLPPASPAPLERPFSAGEVIGRSFSVWLRNFVPFSVVTLLINVPLLVLAAAAPLDAGPAWSLLLNAVSGLAELVVAGALTYGVLEALRGSRVPLGMLLRTGFAKLGRVFVVSLGVGVRVFLGTLLLVIPGIVLFCRLYVAIPAAVVEPIDPTDAIDRSRTLTEGSRWGIFLVALVAFLVTLVVGGVAGLVLVLGGSALPPRVIAVLGTAIGALASPLAACASAVAYHDLRVAKEGVDPAALVKVFE
jgi:hypothetical protein